MVKHYLAQAIETVLRARRSSAPPCAFQIVGAPAALASDSAWGGC
jgi:hypothetical protein